VNPSLLEKERVSLFSETLKPLYFKYLLVNITQCFANLLIVAEKIELAITTGKTRGQTISSKVMARDELEDGSQVGNLSHFVQPGLIVSSITYMSLSNIDIPIPFEFVYQHLLDFGFVTLTPSNLIQPPFSRWYNDVNSYKNFK
jgi:hypothetical protein